MPHGPAITNLPAILLGLVLLLLGTAAGAQPDRTDSLLQVLDEAPADSIRLNTLLELSSNLYRTQADSAILFGEKARDLALRLDDGAAQTLALKNIGLAYYTKADYLNALEQWQQALDQYRQIDDQTGVSNLLSNIGAIYYNRGNDVKAIEYYLQSLRVSEELRDTSRIASTLSNIGAAYDMKEATSARALTYYRRALPLLEKIGDPISYGITLGNIGSVFYEDLGQLDSARIYYEAAEEAFQEQNEVDPYTLYRLGEVLADQGDITRAVQLQQKAYEVATQRDAKLDMAQALAALGHTYLKAGRAARAIPDLREAERLAEAIGSVTAQEEIFDHLSQAYAQLGNYREAFAYKERFTQVRDTLYNIENDRRIEGLQFQFDLEKKEAQIDLLNSENELKQAEIERASLQRNFLLATALFLVVTVCGITYSYWYARRSNKIITEERNRSESILLNILPEETAEELKQNGQVSAKRFERVTVLFTDFKEFTRSTNGIPPEEVVKSVDYYFRAFDKIISRHQLEKIKTIGDAYMCAGGLPIPNQTHPEDAVAAGLDIIKFVETIKSDPPEGIITFDIRVGVHTGPVVAGVVGTKKFQYDIWGTTVNIASVMEENSLPNRVNISNATFELVRDKFRFEYREEITSKHGDKLKMYLVSEAAPARVAQTG